MLMSCTMSSIFCTMMIIINIILCRQIQTLQLEEKKRRLFISFIIVHLFFPSSLSVFFCTYFSSCFRNARKRILLSLSLSLSFFSLSFLGTFFSHFWCVGIPTLGFTSEKLSWPKLARRRLTNMPSMTPHLPPSSKLTGATRIETTLDYFLFSPPPPPLSLFLGLRVKQIVDIRKIWETQ